MKKYYSIFGLDELNYVNYNNFLINDILFKDQYEFYINSPNIYHVLFPSFTHIIDDENPVYKSNYFDNNDRLNQKHYEENNIAEFRNKLLDFYKRNDIHIFEELMPYDFSKHIYVQNFSLIAKQIQSNRINWIIPKKKDYLDIKNQLSKITIPIACIHGRNHYNRNIGRNNLLEPLIKKCIDCGFYVINTTINHPNFEFDNYLEIHDEYFTYSKMISYFLNSNIVFALGDEGGATNHLCSTANFCFLLSKPKSGEHFIDNPIYGFNNISMFDSRKEHFITEYQQTDNVNVNKYLNYNKPKISKFFDDSKIVKLGEL